MSLQRFLLMLAIIATGCGRTRMGGAAPLDGGTAPAATRDAGAGSGGTVSAAGGSSGTSFNAGFGGVGGAGGRPSGGAGGASRLDGAVTGGTELGGRASGGAGGGAGRGSGGVGGRGTGGAGAGGKGGSVPTGTGGTGGSAKPLWRDSREAFCPMTDPRSTFVDVWSDDRGVFVVTADKDSRSAIWSNLGPGWQMTFKRPAGEPDMLYQGGLKGFTNGPLVVYGGFPCGIQFVDGGVAECSGAANFTADLSVVNASLVYAVSYDRVLQFDGELWTQLGGPLPGVGWTSAVWADSSTVVIVANETYGGSLVFKIESRGDPVPLAGLSPQLSPYAVWGFGASDIWVGGSQGELVHYDGVGWSETVTIPYGGAESRSVSGSNGIGKIKLWGKDGNLFAIAGNVFGQWDGTRFKILDTLEGDAYFAGIWGNSSTEVFLAVHDRRSTAACGPFRVRWFDGKAVGPL